jgi:NADH-quinone oxidoreductase subunit C
MSKKEALQAVVEDLKKEFQDDIIDVGGHAGDTMLRVSLTRIHDICQYLYESHHFTYLVDLFGADRFTSEERFEVIYNVISLKTGLRIFLKVWCSEEEPEVRSVTDIWAGANWNEREVWDMFGIRFENHPDLRRIFMPEDFEYHPLRKEFPLLGIPGSIDLPSTTPDTE